MIEVFSLAEVTVERVEADPAEVVAGSPTLGSTPVTTLGDHEIGVWEMSAGSVRDVEADEVFLVLAGAATIKIEGQEPIGVRVGNLVRLTAGTRTVWEVTDPIRKLYLS